MLAWHKPDNSNRTTVETSTNDGGPKATVFGIPLSIRNGVEIKPTIELKKQANRNALFLHMAGFQSKATTPTKTPPRNRNI